jgi:hypothetical protein
MINLNKNIFAGISLFILLEAVILGIHYYLMLNGDDSMFSFFQGTIIVLSALSLCICLYLLVLKIKKKIASPLFYKCFAISFFAMIFPFMFLIFLMSQLH